MQYVQYYECEFCGNRFRSEEDCMEHENLCYHNSNNIKECVYFYSITVYLAHKLYKDHTDYIHLLKRTGDLWEDENGTTVELDKPSVHVLEGSERVYVYYYSVTAQERKVFEKKCLDAFEVWFTEHCKDFRKSLRKI